MEPGQVQGAKVFITYRREETAGHAGRLYDAMVARFGEDNVFMDVDMAPGVDFVERITEAVAACHVLIVVMGPRWATVEDEQGRARLADPEDFVRLEVETALQASRGDADSRARLRGADAEPGGPAPGAGGDRAAQRTGAGRPPLALRRRSPDQHPR